MHRVPLYIHQSSDDLLSSSSSAFKFQSPLLGITYCCCQSHLLQVCHPRLPHLLCVCVCVCLSLSLCGVVWWCVCVCVYYSQRSTLCQTLVMSACESQGNGECFVLYVCVWGGGGSAWVPGCYRTGEREKACVFVCMSVFVCKHVCLCACLGVHDIHGINTLTCLGVHDIH
jgi:hypothetical protein